MSRGLAFIAASRPFNWRAVQPALRYSTTFGCCARLGERGQDIARGSAIGIVEMVDGGFQPRPDPSAVLVADGLPPIHPGGDGR